MTCTKKEIGYLLHQALHYLDFYFKMQIDQIRNANNAKISKIYITVLSTKKYSILLFMMRISHISFGVLWKQAKTIS